MRFLHIADVHLGAVPDRGESWSQEREREIWESFRRVIRLVKEEQIPLLLIAGDLFHRQPLVREVKEVNYLFSTIPDTTVVCMAGNHDYMKKDSAYGKITWAENVIGLWDRDIQAVELPHLHTWVYGCSYYSQEITEPIYDELRPEPEEGFHILLAHGGDVSHVPMDFRKIDAAGFTYVALGHIHKTGKMTASMAYPGALEPIDRNDTGAHGYLDVTCTEKGVSAVFCPFACREYQDLELSVRRETTQFALEEQAAFALRQKGTRNLYRLILTGIRDSQLRFDSKRLKALGNITEVEDRTVPDYDYKELARRYEGTFIGAYIARFQEKGALSEVESLALAYGLQVLLGEEG